MVELLIFPYHGVGPFVLGSSRQAVTLAVGRPDSVETTEVAGNLHEEWHFDQLHIKLSFAADDDWKLFGIGVYGSNAVLNRIRFISQPTAHLVALCEAAQIWDMRQEEDFGEFGICYFSESLGVMLWAVDGYVTTLNIFPKYDEAGNVPCFPKPL
jgi:hypothetical protein